MLGYYMGLSSPPLTKVVAQLGYDLVWIDWEHASTNVETMTQVSKTNLSLSGQEF
jgi:4-hydroxy-2-oxoheptanedioate aldolase